MNKTLQLSPAMLLGIVLTVLPSLGGTVWWVSNLATRLEVTETRIANSNTTALLERVTVVEGKSQFNNDSIKELYNALENFQADLKNTEDELSAWTERELAKIYDIINDNPLGK